MAIKPKIITGVLTSFDQTIRLEPKALSHLYQHRQIKPFSTESGGQLFGKIEDDVVRIVLATGPYKGDERSRYRYRSNQRAAQVAIDQQSQAGMLYLGEWHTHAEDKPKASSLDKNALQKIIKNSKLNSNFLIMLIMGRLSNHEGIALYSMGSNAGFMKRHLWEV